LKRGKDGCQVPDKGGAEAPQSKRFASVGSFVEVENMGTEGGPFGQNKS
jgi:hypothetical protein